MKDVLPTNLLSKIVYSFEYRQCDSWYVGRTLQHLNARIKQHVPLHLSSSEARGLRPRRGRPLGDSVPVTCMQPALTLDTECDAMVKAGVRKSVRLRNEKRTDGTVNGRDNVGTLKWFLFFNMISHQALCGRTADIPTPVFCEERLRTTAASSVSSSSSQILPSSPSSSKSSTSSSSDHSCPRFLVAVSIVQKIIYFPDLTFR